MDMLAALRALAEERDLTGEEMSQAMRLVMTGQATPAQIGAFLMGLRLKGETVTEIAAAARVMRELATRVVADPEHLVDTCGTGGDASGSFNISTAVAFVAAGALARVAKHGNRSVSSKSGSADVLEAAGVRLDLSPAQVARLLAEVGVGFLFAPAHHGAMKHAIGPRRELGMRTIFNLLGPLTNPAGAPNQVLGVFAESWVEPLARVLAELGSRHVLVVHGLDGLDEISLSGPTAYAELKDGRIERGTLTPERFGLSRAPLDALRVDGPQASLAVIEGVLAGQEGPARDIVLLNAGAAIYVAGLAGDIAEGIAAARRSIDSGRARERLIALIEASRSMNP